MLPILLSVLAVLHSVSSDVIINELNADNPQSDDTEYIELYNTDNSAVALDTYVIVLYNGANDIAYDVIYLTRKTIPARGYFVIGSSNVVPTPDFVLPADSNIFQNGPDGVALYNGDPGSFSVGMAVTGVGLVDAIVYSRYAGRPADGLIAILTPGQDIVLEDENFDVLDESLSRCGGTDALNTTQFNTSYPTPGAANDCSLPPAETVTPPATVSTTTPAGGAATNSPIPDIIISELNADNPGSDDQEYLELRNKGSVTVSLRNFVVVFYNGANNQAYYVLDLSSYSIPARGFFTIGSANVSPRPDIVTTDLSIQNGPDAVALYYGDPGSFSSGMTVTNTNLRDVLIYSKRAGDTVAGLSDVLAPGQQLVVENEQAVAEDESISRCGGVDANTLSQFRVTFATPGGENNCAPLPTRPPVTTVTMPPTTPLPTSAPNVVINEVNADNPGADDQEYVELLNKDSTSASLNGLVLVYYNGANDAAYAVIDLSGGTLPANGFFTVGSSNVVPRPDVVTDTMIQNGPDAVALYYGNAADYFVGMTASRANLVDVLLYSSRTGSTADSLLATLAPGQQLVYENTDGTDIDVSASRCSGLQAVMLSQFQATRPTPGGDNNCAPLPTVAPTVPTTVPAIVINELNSDTPGVDTLEFIELYNKGSSTVDISDFQLVLYNGADNLAYMVIQLTGSIPANSYYTVGSSNVTPRPNMVFDDTENVIHNGIDVVALHYQRSDIAVGATVSSVGLVDALVHTKYTPPTESGLIDTLTPGQQPALELSYITSGDTSLGRCSGSDPLTLAQFRMTLPTPGAPNNCNPLATLPPRTTTQTPPVSQIIINEMNADSPSVDDYEYIELYNKENRDVPLDYFVLVLYNGNTNTAYRVLSFNGRGLTIPRQGYFTIGTRNTNPGFEVSDSFLQNGPDAIALYYGDASRYSPGMAVTSDGLVDVVVYVNSGGDSGAGLTVALTPGQPPLHEDSRVLELDESIGRCAGNSPITLSQFRVMLPTPGRPNDCSPLPTSAPNPAPAVVLNELNADNPGTDDREYIELFNTDSVTVRLDNMVLVLFNGHDNAAYAVIDLSRNSIPARGYFVIGSPNLTPSPDIVLMQSQNILQNGVDAVGLYFGRPSQFVVGMPATGVDLVDAIVYSRQYNDSNPQLISALTPGESVLHEDDREFQMDETLSRCGGTTPFQLSLWQVTPPSPGQENRCAPPIVINEVNADNPSVDDQEFIELYNTEPVMGFRLDKMVIVLYDGSSNLRAYKVIKLNGTIEPDGYFVIGSGNVSPRPDMVLPTDQNILQNGPDAVALYHHTEDLDMYTVGMEPTDAFLVDVLVYSRNRRPTELISRLAPGQEIVLESSTVSEVSVSRCGGNDRITLSQFRSTYHTPGRPNNCAPLPTFPPPTGSVTTAANVSPTGLVINEVNADNPSYDTAEFIELYNPGKLRMSLDGVFLVLYNGATDLAYNVVELSGNEVSPESFFVIGSAKVDPQPDLVLERNENILQNGEDGIALYYNPGGRYYGGMTVTAENLLDAVVYSTNYWNGSNLILNTLTPGQQALHEYSRHNPDDMDESLSRCKGVDPTTLSQFVLAYPTPGDKNNCEGLPNTGKYSSGLSPGGVAGVVIAVLIVLGVAAVAGFVLFRRKTSLTSEFGAKAESGIGYNNMGPDSAVKVTGLPVAYDGFDNVLYNFEHGDNLNKVSNVESDT
ncbi:uncharacterized protein LOC144882825 [Branchiostoma floridae x Branchiostoma japonicum]